MYLLFHFLHQSTFINYSFSSMLLMFKYALSVTDAGKVAILCSSLLLHLKFSSFSSLSGESIWCNCVIQHQLLLQRDVTREVGFLFGLLREIISMKTGWMEGEMEEILKGTLYGERLQASADDVLTCHIGRIKIPGVSSTFQKHLTRCKDIHRGGLGHEQRQCPFALSLYFCLFG